MTKTQYQQFLKESIDNIKSIEKFYLFYHSLLVTYNHGVNKILEDLPIELNNPKIIISNLTNSPDKPPHQRIDVEIDDLKRYALEKGQDFAFRSYIIYLYSVLENLIIYSKFGKTTYECHHTINKDILNELNIDEDEKIFIYKLRELRNCFIHDNSIWSVKRAKRLSKVLEAEEDENFNLLLKNKEIKVVEEIRFLDTGEFKWMIDMNLKIVNSVIGGKI